MPAVDCRLPCRLQVQHHTYRTAAPLPKISSTALTILNSSCAMVKVRRVDGQTAKRSRCA